MTNDKTDLVKEAKQVVVVGPPIKKKIRWNGI